MSPPAGADLARSSPAAASAGLVEAWGFAGVTSLEPMFTSLFGALPAAGGAQPA